MNTRNKLCKLINWLTILLVLLVVAVPVLEVAANAAVSGSLTDTQIGLSNSNGTWSATGTTITGSVKGTSFLGSYFSADTTLTITNSRDKEVILSFDYSVHFNEGGESSLAINGTTVCTSSSEGQTITGSSGDITIASGSSINVKLVAGKRSGDNTATLTITNIKAKGVVTFGAVDGSGSYTMSTGSESAQTITDTVVTRTDDCGTTYTLTATPDEGYIFVGWYTDSSTDPVSTDATYAYTNQGKQTIYPKFSLPNATVTFAAAQGNGSYTVNGESAPTSKTEALGTSYTLVATPDSGYTFYCWKDGNGNILSTESTYTLTSTGAATVYPVFVPSDSAMFGVGDKTFYDLNEADAYATSLGGAQINLLRSGTLYSGDYTISAGNTLLIPFDSAYTCYTTAPGYAGDEEGDGTNYQPTAGNTYAYRTLTMAPGAKITVNGVISVSAQHTAGGGGYALTCGSTYGPYGHIAMEDGASIAVNSGGTLYAWGYITGAGKVAINSGGTVYEYFQIADFRGGSATTGMVTTSSDNYKTWHVLPFSQYYVQNVEVEMTLVYGAKEMVYSDLYMGGSCQASTVEFIGTSGMFYIGEGSWVTKEYDSDEDRLIISTYGDTPQSTVTLQSLTVEFSFYYVPYTVNSSDYVLPITNNITINVVSGTAEVASDIALLAGAKVTVSNGAILSINDYVNVYIYDRDEWISGNFVHQPYKMKPVSYSPTKTYTRTEADLVDAVVDVNGYMIVSGNLYTTESGAQIISTEGTGVVDFMGGIGTETVTYQVTQQDTSVAGYAINIYNAWLQNADGSYVKTGEEMDADGAYWVYIYENGKWTARLMISYDGNGATSGSVTAGIVSAADVLVWDDDYGYPLAERTPYTYESVAANGFTRPGYTFAGWNTKADGSGTAYAVGDTIDVTAGVTLYAQWEANSYTITWNVDGVTSTSTQTYDANLTLPTAPTKTGYTFAGWYTEANGGTKVDENTVYQTAGDTTYYAQWTENTYTVTFNANGGSGTMTSQTIGQVTASALTANSFTRTGYSFAGWNTAADGTGTSYTNEQSLTLTGNITLYAQWTANSYNATFNANGGAWADGDTTKTVEDVTFGAAIAAPADPTREGYTFAGWSPAVGNMTAEGMTFEAQWEINQYTITFDTNGGSTISSITLDYGAAITAPADPTREGYTFAGWDVEIPATMPAENLTITAQWTVNSYTLTFKDQDGNVISNEKVNYGAAITYPSTDKTGYTFAGWNSDATTMPANDLTITGTWTVNSYTLTFRDQDGNEISSTEVNYGAAITYPSTDKTGYTFSGWNSDATTMPANDLTIIGTWNINYYTVTWVIDDATTTETYAYGAVITAPATPTKTGYTFKGWKGDAIPTTMGAADVTVTLTSTWTANVYTITWDVDGTTFATTSQTYGTVLTLPDTNPTKDGYTFMGWYTGQDGTGDEVTAETVYRTADADAYYAYFVKNYTVEVSTGGVSSGTVATGEVIPGNGYSYTFTFGEGITIDRTYGSTGSTYTNGIYVTIGGKTTDQYTYDDTTNTITIDAEAVTGDIVISVWTKYIAYTITFVDTDGSEIASITQNYGTAITAPADPTKTGYTFAGWDVEIPVTMPAENLTITATWAINQYTITWVDGDGNTLHTVTQDYNTAITYPANPTKTGYTFNGWDKTIAAVPAENVTITATWTINKYTITWIVNGVTTTETYEYGVTPSFKGSTDKAADAQYTYTFAGWDTEIVAVTGDVTYTATYTSAVNRYTITWIVDGNETTETYEYGETPSFKGSTDKAADAQYTYTFAGWDTEIVSVTGDATYTATYTSVVNKYTITWIVNGVTTTETYEYGATPSFKGSTDKAADAQYTYTFAGWDAEIVAVTGDATYIATYTSVVNQYTLTWIVDGVETEVTYDFGATIDKIADPEKEGYTFAGWDVEIPATMPAQDLTITATWTINQYTVTWIVDGVENEVTYDFGATINKLADPEKEGYTFSGWDKEIPETMPAEDLVFAAKWEINTYTVTVSVVASGADPVPYTYSVTHGGTLTADAGDWKLDTCYTVRNVEATVDVSYDGTTLTINNVTGDITVTVNAEQYHTVGDVVMENYVAATCTEDGSYDLVAYCSECGVSIKTVHYTIDATGHTEVIDAAVEATCTATGLTEGKHCSDCGEILVAQETVAATGHNYSYLDVHSATCTEDGYFIFGCDDCGQYFDSRYDIEEAEAYLASLSPFITIDVTAKGHTAGETVVENAVDATCTTNGHYDEVVYCTVCGEELSRETVTVAATGHNYNYLDVHSATCTEDGYFIFGCSDCGQYFDSRYDIEEAEAYLASLSPFITIDVTAKGHTAGETVVENAVDATCTTNGHYDEVIYCTVCGEELSRETVTVAATGHSHTAVVTAPTCTKAGYTTYTCACGHSYIADVQEATGHSYTSQVTKEATCTEVGVRTYTCTCGDSYTEEIPVIAHSFGETQYIWSDDSTLCGAVRTCTCGHVETAVANMSSVTVDATCTADGKTTYTATFAADWAETQTAEVLLPAAGHAYGEVAYTWSADYSACTASRVCACGHAETVTATVTSAVTNATCTEAGYTVYTATFAADWAETQTAEVAGDEATGHDYGEAIYVWSADYSTCTAIHTCSCGAFETEAVETTGVVTNVTCTADGYTTYTAAFSADWTQDQTVVVAGDKATGHDYEIAVTAPTCTTAGYTTYTCACGETYVSDYVAAKGHSYESVVTAPTCTEAGYTTYTCACGETYVSDYVAAKGHSYESVVTAPTCTEDGYTTYICACDHSYVSDYVAAKGHSYESVVTAPTCTEAGYTTYTCACGETYVSDYVAAKGHSYESVVTAPTCTEAGYTTYTCACGHSYVGNDVAANGHYDAIDDNDHICDSCDYVCGEHLYVDGKCNCGDVLKFTITWIIDGVETTEVYTYGQIPTAPEAVKAADGTYTYTFMGWDKTINPATEDATYTAIFAKTGWYTDENGTTYLVEDQMVYFGEWAIIGDAEYYFETSGYIAKDICQIRGVLFVFDKETGVFLSDYTGVYVTNADKTYYVENGIVNRDAGLVRVVENGEAHYYYFCYNADKCNLEGCACDGSAVKNGVHWTEDNNGLLVKWDYTFDENGVIVYDAAYATHAEPHHEVVTYDGVMYYTIDGVKVHYGLFQDAGGKYYYARSSGALVTDRAYYVTDTNGLLPADSYLFGADGAIIMEPTFVTGEDGIYYYCNGVLTYGGLIEINGDYYYVRSNGQLVTGRTYWITKTNGLMEEKAYTFDETGKMVIEEAEEEDTTTGIVNVDGVLYYYKNGSPYYAGLIEIDGNYYYVRTNGQLVVSQTYWITKTNGLMAEKAYTFDSEGKMIVG